ncbi:Lactaldehyde dehydrogenase [Colletotrichum gloeosporioides]|uniref:aldehyde dehydrogenase (NAD(+)) n=1 Tax=Colletotrichum gloeosporioides TaxID=474922 RepID=A0A8H4FQR6_COLGL|nr:Lactaldehyde dehydrogenase [Colletotrichum gloeosporioides]KAF3810932.1 Lactaldehyde dehydrogenase [Colletotrichum gloeosporioides]
MSTTTIQTISPSTNKVLLNTPSTSLEDAKAIAKSSQDAFQKFKLLSLAERKEMVMRGLKLIQERKHDLGRELSEQMGRPIAYSHKEIETMQKRADYLLDIAEEALRDIPGRPEAGFKRRIKKVPVGPTLVVFAWNFPYLIIVNALVPALLAGNTVILKPSPQTPLVGTRIAEIFAEAGLPTNVLQIVQSGDPTVLNELVRIPEIQAVSFTGSTAGGLALREAAARRTIPLNLELGGNDPAYVRPDADLKYVAAQLVDGAVFNSGQSCCAVERIYVHKDIHDTFVQELQDELKTYKLGDPLDASTNVGPVISRAAQKSIEQQVEDALSKGARDVTPFNATFENHSADGNYVIPRILTGVTHDMIIAKEETFGPVIPVICVQNDDEAIKLMNDTDYGLTASVWTTDIPRGEEMIESLEAGTVFVNRCDYPNPDLAWTGWKKSGLGCTLGPKGFDFFVKLKSRLEGKNIIVTGAAGGIGLEASILMYKEGGSVLMTDINQAVLNKALACVKELVPNTRGRLESLVVDVSSVAPHSIPFNQFNQSANQKRAFFAVN